MEPVLGKQALAVQPFNHRDRSQLFPEAIPLRLAETDPVLTKDGGLGLWVATTIVAWVVDKDESNCRARQ